MHNKGATLLGNNFFANIEEKKMEEKHQYQDTG
jgi:hypothetical protein